MPAVPPAADPLVDLAGLEGVPSAVAAALAGVDVVLRDRGRRAVPAAVRAWSRATAARANAGLEARPERWRPGALRLAGELDVLAPLLRSAPAQALARGHLLLARGVVPDDQLGRVRVEPAVTERLAGLAGLLTGGTAASALVLGAVVHGELATVAAFGDGDGALARPAEQLVLAGAGIDPLTVLPLPAGHAADAVGYRSALAGYADGGLPGVRTWLLWCCRAVATSAELLAAGPRSTDG